ncbi:MAG: lipopolysaccharide biosynthesis protein [Pseudonocardiaceae bacterium]
MAELIAVAAVMVPASVLLGATIMSAVTGAGVIAAGAIMLGSTAVGASQEAALSILLHRGRVGRIASLELFRGATMLCAAALLFVSRPTLTLWAALYCSAGIVVSGATISQAISASGGVKFRRLNVGDRIRTGVRIAVGRAAESGYVNVDQVMLPIWASLADVGRYALAQAVMRVGLLVIFAVIDAMRVRLFQAARGPSSGFEKEVRNLSRGCAAVGALVVPGCAVAGVLVEGAIGPGYSGVGLLSTALSAALVFRVLSTPRAWALTAMGYDAERSRIQVVTLIGNASGNVLLLPIWGVYGAVATTVASEAAMWFLASRACEKVGIGSASGVDGQSDCGRSG